MTSKKGPGYTLRRADGHVAVTFTAMASPCEVLIRDHKTSEAGKLASLAVSETRRIEHKYSRYRDDNIVHAINHSNGEEVPIDDETSRLLQYAAQCHQLSDGRFDITSGILRRAWRFDGTEVVPDPDLIASLLSRVGWQRVRLDDASVRLEPDMEIDLGGIGKEYAADRVASLVAEAAGADVLVNLGGDIRAIPVGADATPWRVGIEAPGQERDAVGRIEIGAGGVATSGDARRYCFVEGERLGHILDPRTGWPVAGAPRSATVIADNCTAAGFLSTMAMLHGGDAEAFLDAQDVTHHCIR
jgi:thiamine biosynthesis lipoprotein